MAASFTIAARNNGLSKVDARAATLASVRAYRQSMGEFAAMRTMDIWYANMSEGDRETALDKARSHGIKAAEARGHRRGGRDEKEEEERHRQERRW